MCFSNKSQIYERFYQYLLNILPVFYCVHFSRCLAILTLMFHCTVLPIVLNKYFVDIVNVIIDVRLSDERG